MARSLIPCSPPPSFPHGITRALVVLFPAAKGGKEPYRSLVLNHDLQDFPLGVYRLINVSPHPIRGAIARDYIEAKPGGVANLEPAGEPGAVVPVRFEFFDQGPLEPAHGNPLRHPQGPALAHLHLSRSRHRPDEHPQHPRPHPRDHSLDRVALAHRARKPFDPEFLRNSPGVIPIFFLNKRLMYSGCSNPAF